MYGGKFAFQIDWASLQWEGNVPFLLCFTLYSRANSNGTSRGAHIQRGDLTEGFLRFDFGGLIFGWAYKCWGLFLEFYGKFCFVAQDI